MYNLRKLHQELIAAGIPIKGIGSVGAANTVGPTSPDDLVSEVKIDFLPPATDEQMALADEILKKHDPVDYEAKRWEEYPDVRRMVLALLLGGEDLQVVKTAVLAVNLKHPMP